MEHHFFIYSEINAGVAKNYCVNRKNELYIWGCRELYIYENTNINTAPPYSAIKAGVINYTRYLASYYGRHSVRVNCVSPCGILDNQHETFVTNYVKKVPMGRMGNPDGIIAAVSFLLSDEAKYITGQNLIVDGGWTAV